MIPVYEPFRAKNQQKYVDECLSTNWISSRGRFVDLFEQKIQDIIGVKHAIAVCNGTVSLQLILAALGIGYGDEVIVPNLTYCATVSAIHWAGATPVLVDSDNYLQMSLDLNMLESSITPNTRAIMVPQLYGDSPDMDTAADFCKKKGLFLIEDSAEAFGCSINGRMIGSWGEAASFSFFSNKTIATGEGGAVVTNDDALAAKMRLLKSQNHIGGFIHPGPGFNFRMTNIHAAIGVAQLEDMNEIVSKKAVVADFYRKNLDAKIFRYLPRISSVDWMPIFGLSEGKLYSEFATHMTSAGIDTRPCFTPISKMPGWKYAVRSALTTSEQIHMRAFNLPSYPDLTDAQLRYIVDAVNDFVRQA